MGKVAGHGKARAGSDDCRGAAGRRAPRADPHCDRPGSGREPAGASGLGRCPSLTGGTCPPFRADVRPTYSPERGRSRGEAAGPHGGRGTAAIRFISRDSEPGTIFLTHCGAMRCPRRPRRSNFPRGPTKKPAAGGGNGRRKGPGEFNVSWRVLFQACPKVRTQKRPAPESATSMLGPGHGRAFVSGRINPSTNRGTSQGSHGFPAGYWGISG